MARVTLASGETITVGGTTEIFGTAGVQSVTVIDGSVVTFRSGFNSGGDAIRLTGTASDFVVSRSGSNVILTSSIDGISVTIPVGTTANTIVFDNGDTRSLVINGLGQYVLGAQVIGTVAAAVTAGPGTYTVAGDAAQHIEGTAYTFTVTRTDTSSAESLTYSVGGNTNGGTVNAATAGTDFTAAGSTINFAVGVATAVITVNLNVDNAVEGIEGLGVQVFKGAQQVATTTGLIADANNVGQTFVLTTGIDRVGNGVPSDLIGSEGSASTVGNDRILGTNGTGFLNLLGTVNIFDNINAGAGNDSFEVLDNGAPFTSAPSFTNVTVANVENFEYTSLRGLAGGSLNTSGWTGLQTLIVQVVSNSAQTITSSTAMTDMLITNAGDGDVNVNGGAGGLTINASTDGNVNVGQTGTNNVFAAITVNGGDDIAITDTGNQELATINLNGFDDDANLFGSAIATVNVSNLSGGSFYRDVNISASNPTVNLTGISVGDLDVTASNNLIVNADGNSISGLDDLTANGSNATVNSTNGYLYFDDLNVNGVGATATLNDMGGGFSFDLVQGSDLRDVNINLTNGWQAYINTIDGSNANNLTIDITDAGYAYIGTVVEAGGPSGTTITATNAGGVYVDNQLGNNTQFNGSGDTGSDFLQFGASNRANSFGGGDDNVTLNSATLGVNGSLDGGAQYDRLRMESNNAASFTSVATATSNFEELVLTFQAIGKTDTINLANAGFSGNLTNVVSFIGPAAPVTEVVNVSFNGVATSTDQVTFQGETVNFVDNSTPAMMAAAFIAQTGGSTTNWTSFVNLGGGVVQMTRVGSGFATDLTAGAFTFTDAQTVGKPTLETISLLLPNNPDNVDDGNAPVTGVTEVFQLTLTSATVLGGETVTITGSTGGAHSFTFAPPALGGNFTQAGGALADAVRDAANADPDFSALWTATVVGQNVVFTASSPGARADLVLSGTGLDALDTYSFAATTQGVTAIAGDDEDAFFVLDGFATGNDTLTFDNITVTFTGAEANPTALRNTFISQYNAEAGRTYNASAGLGGVVILQSIADANLAPLTAANFVFGDDTNIGTPSVGVTVTTQGSTSSVVLNNFTSGATLTLESPNGTHTVNLNTNTAADVFNLNLSTDGNHGSVTAPNFETVNINTSGNFAGGTDTLVLSDAAAKTITITGTDGLTLDTDSTVIQTLNASGLSAKLTWTADANTANPITISTGTGGSDVDLSAITLSGLAPIVFLGGAGADEVTLGNIGTARATITLGGGLDVVNVGVGDGGNDYSTITDFTSSALSLSKDVLHFDAAGSFVALRDQTLEPTATFQDYLDQAANAAADGKVHWFAWQGDTYVVQNNSNAAEFEDGVDVIIKLTGAIDLTAANVAFA